MFISRLSVISSLALLFFCTLSTTVSAAIVSSAVTTGNNTSSGATTLIISKPASVTVGDFLLASITYDKGASTAIGTPSGWTLIRVSNNGSKIGLATYYKVAGGSEPSSYTWTLTPSRTAVGGIVRYTGVEVGNPVDTTSDATGPTPISGLGFVTSETTNNFTAGTYTLSESGGPSGYSASTWSCVGDTVNTGNSITLGIGQNSTCTITNDDNP